jgi:hypothetical protein
MTYRVEYNGRDLEVSALDAALDGAKDAIAADVGPVSGFAVEHDETINDWFVQGVVNGEPVGSTAVVTGPEPTMVADPQPVSPAGRYRSHRATEPVGDWVRTITFTGVTPAEVFGKATTWLAARPDAVEVGDVGWQDDGVGAYQLRVHYRGEAAGSAG